MSGNDPFRGVPDFPILRGAAVPWGMAEKARFQLVIRHGLSPERLAARGGVTAGEFLAALRDWPHDDPRQLSPDVERWLESEVKAYRARPGWPVVKLPKVKGDAAEGGENAGS